METVVIMRDGQIKLRVPAEIRNGILWHGKNILINCDLIKPPYTNDTVFAAIKSGNITPEIEAMGIFIGDNGNGLIVRWAKDIDEEEKAKRQAAYDALPAQVKAAREERKAINDLYYRSERSLNHDTDDDNVSRGYRLQAEANHRLKKWIENYPHAAAKERAETLINQADHNDSLADGALVYDADGLIDPIEQQHRHDEYHQKATELRAQAQEIIQSLPQEWK